MFRVCSLLLVVIVLCSSCTKQARHRDFKNYFEEYGVEGCFILYDLKRNKFDIYNEARTNQRFYPASTFKILNTLIALETDVTKDKNFFLEWDGIEREVSLHNQDHNLKQAFHNSTVWFYQEIARRVGKQQMQAFVNKANYGNEDTGDLVDQFWLQGPLEISPMEQILFLKNLYFNKLPFSKKTLDLAKQIMVREENPSYILRAKTGTTVQNGQQLCWYVGYIEQANNVYFFVLNVESSRPDNFLEGNAVKARIKLTEEILRREYRLL